ncbi:MAG TPA: ISAzo13 family transposase [Candidatus Dormibacteraeota bacterium]|nr:ISAzo13 family transposase [Candidatus Dormibacteraeota bacterium]
MDDTIASIRTRWEAIAPHFDERLRRLWACAEARSLGRGGITRVSRATGLSRQTLHTGMKDLEAPPSTDGRIRRVGAGRKPQRQRDPELEAALDALLDPDVRGDPESPLRWTCKSTGQLALALTRGGHPVSATTVGVMLKQAGFSLQANVKTKEGAGHPERDAQFRYLNEQARQFRDAGLPVLSVDCKKKELIGEFKNGGREWAPKGEPVKVNIHDFVTEQGKAIPYGIYDVERNVGWVNVGQDHETAAFAVESLRRWWRGDGALAYPDAEQLLICADGGGSNGYRTRLWKWELWRFAQEAGLDITVCHLPPGTSKWNKIEHRLFSHISMNWRGRPLISHEVVVQLIAATTSKTGLKVHAERDLGSYPTNVPVSDTAMADINLLPHSFHGEWNYSLAPHP